MVSALAFSARGHGFDPRSRQENISATEHAFLSVICRDDTVRRPSDRDVNWRPPVQGESPHVQVKEPYSSFHSAKQVCTMYAWSLSSRDPLDRDVKWSAPPHPPCRESHPLSRLKNTTVVYMITCRLSFCKTGVYNVCLLIILERECSSMYRKKRILVKSYAKESFF